MTAQIRPNRMEVSDRFPMLGFAVHSDEADINAEVVLATDINLFQQQNRARRTAANFYSSREHGILQVPRGEGVFVVPPEVLARFIGNDRLYFGLATGRRSNGGLHVDAIPRDGSPYVSLRGFTGRTLRRSMGGDRQSAPPMLDWTGDVAQPGSQPAPNGNGASGGKGNGGNGSSASKPDAAASPPAPPAAAQSARSMAYDDGFGAMPDIMARAPRNIRQANVRRSNAQRYGLSMGSGLTAQRALDWIKARVEEVVGAVGSDVDPPVVYRLGSNSAAFRTAWKAVNTAASLFSPISGFLGDLPDLADSTGVTLSVGPALDTPLFGGGVGVVFEPGGQVALFGQGDISVDVEGITEFLKSLKAAIQAKMKLGYNNGGIAGFASCAKVASVAAGEEVVVGAEIWLDSSGKGLGGAVTIGAGFALELAAEPAPSYVPPVLPSDPRERARRIGGTFPERIGQALDLGLQPQSIEPLLSILEPQRAPAPMGYYARAKDNGDDQIQMPAAPGPRARAMDGGVSAAIAVATFVIETISNSKGDVSWDLDQLRGIKHPNDTAPANPGPFRDGATINLDDWPVSGGLVDDISAWFKIDWQYNGQSLGNVRITNIGTNDAVGWGLTVRAQIMDDNKVYPPNNCAALRLTFHYRFDRSIGSDVIAIRNVTLYGDGTWQTSGDWVQSSTFAAAKSAQRGYARAKDDGDDDQIQMPAAPGPRARAMEGGAGNAISVAKLAIETISNSTGDVSWTLDQMRGIKHPNDTAPANPGPFRDGATINLDDWPVSGGLVDDISAWFKIDWQYNGQSLGNVRITNIGTNDAVGWGLTVRAQIMDDNKVYPPNNCAALRLTFHYRFDRSIGSDVIAIRNVTLYGDGTWASDGDWVQSSTFAATKDANRKRPGQRNQGQRAYA